MTRRVALYFVGSLVLVSLAGCGRGFFQTAEREPWRAEAEAACLKSGEVRESADLVRIRPINGPGICGAEFPLKVSALGENPAYGFADEDLRPPASIGRQPRWPITQPASRTPPPSYRETPSPQPTSRDGSNGPVSLTAPGVYPAEGRIELPPEGTRDNHASPNDRYGQPYPQPQSQSYGGTQSSAYPATPALELSRDSSLRLGPERGTVTSAVGPIAVKPSATLACPIVSALDRWLADAVQPASMRWFGARVVEIKQISAYSCRGMNGNPRAHISEHAFGNALDIAGFTLADGRYVSVQRGWKGLPEEQGFLRDVEASACQRFTTVLAPGSNVHHYNHIHVDLMRRASRRTVCKPAAVSGEEIAARAAARSPFASREPIVTGSFGGSKNHSHSYASEADYDE
jgi:hypothetical protein